MTPSPTPHPPIVLCLSDYDTLEKAALAALLHAPRLAGALLNEVDRAIIVADADLRPNIVRLGSWVEFSDSLTGELRRARLVVSVPEGPVGDHLSALSVEGAALIGLREGQAIAWNDRIGGERVLTVVSTRNVTDGGPIDLREGSPFGTQVRDNPSQ